MYARNNDLTYATLYLENAGVGPCARFSKGDVTIIGGNVGIGTTTPGVNFNLHVIGNIAYTGNIYDVSDIRLKENITPLDNALAKVSAINGIYFNNKEEPPENREVGVIAQEVKKVLPEVVSEDSEGFKSVDYSKFTPLLIEAVKELKAENERLRVQDEALQRENYKIQIQSHELQKQVKDLFASVEDLEKRQ